MRKLVISILFIFISVVTVDATTVLYRISSGEVMEISTQDKTDFGMGLIYFAVLTDPPLTDGTEWLSPAPDFERRSLGYAKINDNGTIRNATQNEIDTFAILQQDDRNKRDAAKAIGFMDTDPQFRRILIALIKGIIREDNQNRLWIRDFKAAVAASTSLADFQSRVAALDTPTDREFQDAKDYIIDQVSKDD